MKNPKKLRRWKGRAALSHGQISAVHRRDGRPFNDGMFMSNEWIDVEILETRKARKETGK